MSRTACIVLTCVALGSIASQSTAQPAKPETHYPIDTRLSAVRPPAPAAETESALSADEPESGVDLNHAQNGDVTLQAKMDTVLSIIGKGYNTFAREPEGSCMDGQIYGPVPTAHNINYSLTMITSFEEFKKDTAVEASLSSSFGKFSASVKSKFEQSQHSTQRSEFLLMKEYVALAPEINLRNPTVVAYYRQYDLSIPSQADEFYSKCGDSYISQVQMGGEMVALLTVNESTYQENSNLSIEASGEGFSTTATASFDEKMESLKKQGSVDATVNLLGGDGRPMPGATMDSLIQYANEFPAQVSTSNGVPIGFTTTSYFTLTPGIMNVSRFRDEHAVFDQVEQKRNQLSDLIAAMGEDRDVLVRNNVPKVRTKGDIIDAIDQAAAAGTGELPPFDDALRKCALAFWTTGGCAFSSDLTGYQLPARPYFVLQRVDAGGSTAEFDVPVPVNVELRGYYCFDGPASCWRGWAGVTQDDAAYLTIDGGRYSGAPVLLSAGHVSVRAQDSDYSDNAGELYAFLYQK